MDLRPFVLMDPLDEGGRWMLILNSRDARALEHVFRKASRHPGGYGWEGVALFFLEQRLCEADASAISLDCENDSFVASAAMPDPLLRLAEFLVPLTTDADALTDVLTRAPLDGWSELFLRH